MVNPFSHCLIFVEHSNIVIDLFDYVYELTDSLTFHSRAIAPSMWRIFELTYSAFKTDAVDFLEGKDPSSMQPFAVLTLETCRDVAHFGQFHLLRF